MIFIHFLTDSAQEVMVTTKEAAQALLTEKVEFLRMRISHLTVDYITMKMKHTLRGLLQVFASSICFNSPWKYKNTQQAKIISNRHKKNFHYLKHAQIPAQIWSQCFFLLLLLNSVDSLSDSSAYFYVESLIWY